MKLKIKGERDKQLSYAFIALASLLLLSGVGNVLTGSRQVTELARNERDIARQTDTQERGRMPEHEEQTLSRTIQKER